MAIASKPSPPATVTCSTLSVSGNTYTAECDVQSTEKGSPEGISLLEPAGKGVRMISTEAPSGKGLGKWLITMELDGEEPVPLVFELHHGGKYAVRIGGMFDPFNKMEKTSPKKGEVKTDSQGNVVQEFPSR